MNGIFETVSNISTPLGIAGLSIAVLYLLLKNLLRIRTKAEKQPKFPIKLLINWLFVLSLISIILGFIGFILPWFNNNTPGDNAKFKYTVTILFKNKPLQSAAVSIVNTSQTEYTNSQGEATFEIDTAGGYEIALMVIAKEIADTILTYSSSNLPSIIKLSERLKKDVSPTVRSVSANRASVEETVSGVIVDSRSKPISGVIILYKGQKVCESDLYGSFSFSHEPLLSDDIEIQLIYQEKVSIARIGRIQKDASIEL